MRRAPAWLGRAGQEREPNTPDANAAVRERAGEPTASAPDASGPAAPVRRSAPVFPREEPTDSGPPAYAQNPRLTLWGLTLSLLGFLGLAFLVYHAKFVGAGYSIGPFPARDLFVGFLCLAFAPFFVTIFRRQPALFLLPPLVVIFLIYPLFAPHGIVYSRDPIFNFQFANALLEQGSWVPLQGVTAQAGTYSFFPASAVYGADTATMLGLPLVTTSLFGLPLLRMLIFPATVYALTCKLFGTRFAAPAVLFYVGVPSILFNMFVQEEFAVVFFALSILALAFIAHGPAAGSLPLRIVLLVFSSLIVLSHHVTSYVFMAWLAGLILLPLAIQGRDTFPSVGIGRVFGRYFLVFLLWVFFVSAPVIVGQVGLLQGSISALLQGVAPTGSTATLAHSFPLYQQIWIVGAILVPGLCGLLLFRVTYSHARLDFLTTNLLVAVTLILGSIVFLPTSLNFLRLRGMEYAGLFLAPATVWWISRRAVPGLRLRLQRFPRAPWRSGRPPGAWRRVAPKAVAVGMAALLFAGGNLALLDTRDQFAHPDDVGYDSPLFLTQADYQLGVWARTHLNQSRPFWGDYLAYDVFAGFGQMDPAFDAYVVFNGTNITRAAWTNLSVGEYVITDVYMTLLTPTFRGPSHDQPTSPMSPEQVAKFDQPRYFATVYAGATFTIYELTAKPNPLPP